MEAEITGQIMKLLATSILFFICALVYDIYKLLKSTQERAPCCEGCNKNAKIKNGLHLTKEGKPYMICQNLACIRK